MTNFIIVVKALSEPNRLKVLKMLQRRTTFNRVEPDMRRGGSS